MNKIMERNWAKYLICPCEIVENEKKNSIVSLLKLYLGLASEVEKKAYYHYLVETEFSEGCDINKYIGCETLISFYAGFEKLCNNLIQKNVEVLQPTSIVLRNILSDVIPDKKKLGDAMNCSELDVRVLQLFVSCLN